MPKLDVSPNVMRLASFVAGLGCFALIALVPSQAVTLAALGGGLIAYPIRAPGQK